MTTAAERIARARLALEGLSWGDAFGEQFFRAPAEVERMLTERGVPRGPWPYTDDTAMAISIVRVLAECEAVEQDRLAELFASAYAVEPARGYGGGAHRILTRIGRGHAWRDAARAEFGGEGSKGNGGAMRAAPVGAYFADDLARAAEEARKSAEVTHAHPEGQAGAVAVAVAAAIAHQLAEEEDWVDAFFDAVLDHMPDGVTRRGIERARGISADEDLDAVVGRLGNGSDVLAEDTVPFCIWAAAHHLESYMAALWCTVAALGDRDTTCAIVGGIVILANGPDAIPRGFEDAREALPEDVRGL